MSLIENILSLEAQANQVVEAAKAEAKRLEADTEKRVAQARAEVTAAVDQRVAAFRADAEAKVARELKSADEEFRAAGEKLSQIPAEKVAGQVKAVAARLAAGANTGA